MRRDPSIPLKEPLSLRVHFRESDDTFTGQASTGRFFSSSLRVRSWLTPCGSITFTVCDVKNAGFRRFEFEHDLIGVLRDDFTGNYVADIEPPGQRDALFSGLDRV